MIGQGPYSLFSDLLGCLLWAAIWFCFFGGGWAALAVLTFFVGLMFG
jgi:hypothetical protein